MTQVPLTYRLKRASILSLGRWSEDEKGVIRIGGLEIQIESQGVHVRQGDHVTWYKPTTRERVIAYLDSLPQPPELNPLDDLRAIEPFTLIQACEALKASKRHTNYWINRLYNQGYIMVDPTMVGPQRWITTRKARNDERSDQASDS
jgi:hypothetical protein